ncbi:major facilitator superfamily domain-containing protein [Gymnopilus junonius]|uniref:Major facilitator superfamily domain-containing protein n=1 Tax=Gymnopilus junonius TaxID=109634 RepID=A0A9P5TNC8_GYMJU|nr:major facilitator superfamily domain-containing protein [Gymnopilus junonius]
MPERPAPILQLPGLPPQELPRSVLTPRKRTFKEEFAEKVENSRNWLAQFRAPWSRDPRVSVIPPVTERPPSLPPKTFDFIREEAGHWGPSPKTAKSMEVGQWGASPKSAKFVEESLGYGAGQTEADYIQDEYSHDPPPLYKKHPTEGGVHGWLSVAGAYAGLTTIAYPIDDLDHTEHYNHVYLTDQNPVAVRFIGSIQLFLAFFLSIVTGKLTDMGYYRFIVHPGSALFAIWKTIGMGVGMGLVLMPTTVIPLHYFKRRRGLAIGIVMSGGSLGGMVFPPVLRALISLRGFGSAVRVTACIIIACLFIGNGLLRTPPKEGKPLFPVPFLDLTKYSGELNYVGAAIATFLAVLFIYWPAMYLDLLGMEKGVNPNLAFYTIIILSFTSVIARVGLGLASTFQGPKSLVAYSIFYGIFSGAWLSLIITTIASLASRKSELGTRIGLIFTLGSIAFLLSALVHDAVLTAQHVWAIPSAVSGVIFLAVAVLIGASRMVTVVQKEEKSRKRLAMLKDIPILEGLVIV